MKVIGKQTAEFEISPHEQKRVCLEYIYRNFNWGERFHIDKDNEKVMRTIEHHSYRYWEEKEFVRNAVPLDYSVETVVSQIKTYLPK